MPAQQVSIVEKLEERLEKNPVSLSFPRLADAYRKSGDIPRAIEVCTKGLKSHPEYTTGRIILGRCYLEQENFGEAIEEFKKVCQTDRHNHVAIKMLADIFSKQNMEEKAGDLYAILRKMDPDNPSLVHLSSVFKGAGRTEVYEIVGIAPRVAPVPEEAAFADEGGAISVEETTHQEAEAPAAVAATVDGSSAVDEGGVAVTGEDVSDRMDEMFADESAAGSTETATEDGIGDILDSSEFAAAEEQPADGAEAAGEQPEGMRDEAEIMDVATEVVPAPEEELAKEEPPVTGDDIGDRMDSLFGESEETEESEELATVETVEEAPEVKPPATEEAPSPEADAGPSGSDISNRLDDMFGETVVEGETPTPEPEAASAEELSLAEEPTVAAEELAVEEDVVGEPTEPAMEDTLVETLPEAGDQKVGEEASAQPDEEDVLVADADVESTEAPESPATADDEGADGGEEDLVVPADEASESELDIVDAATEQAAEAAPEPTLDIPSEEMQEDLVAPADELVETAQPETAGDEASDEDELSLVEGAAEQVAQEESIIEEPSVSGETAPAEVEAETEGGIVDGSDIVDRIDSMFEGESTVESPPEQEVTGPEAAEENVTEEDDSGSSLAEAVATDETIVMDQESLMRAAGMQSSGTSDKVTGEDVSSRIDEIFGEEGAAGEGSEMVDLGDGQTADLTSDDTYKIPTVGATGPEAAPAEDVSDQYDEAIEDTATFAVLDDANAEQTTPSADISSETAVDAGDASAGETIPAEDAIAEETASPDFSDTVEVEADQIVSEPATVTGDDVADRLDEIFADEDALGDIPDEDVEDEPESSGGFYTVAGEAAGTDGSESQEMLQQLEEQTVDEETGQEETGVLETGEVEADEGVEAETGDTAEDVSEDTTEFGNTAVDGLVVTEEEEPQEDAVDGIVVAEEETPEGASEEGVILDEAMDVLGDDAADLGAGEDVLADAQALLDETPADDSTEIEAVDTAEPEQVQEAAVTSDVEETEAPTEDDSEVVDVLADNVEDILADDLDDDALSADALPEDDDDEEDTASEGFYNVSGDNAQSAEANDDVLATINELEEESQGEGVDEETPETQPTADAGEEATVESPESAMARTSDEADVEAEIDDVLDFGSSPDTREEYPATAKTPPVEMAEPEPKASGPEPTPVTRKQTSTPAGPPSESIPDHVLTPTLADIYYQQGQPRLAAQIYSRLLEKDPDSDKIQERLEQIEKEITQLQTDAESGPAAEVSAKPKPKSSGRKSTMPQRTSGNTRPLKGVRIKKKVKERIHKARKKS